MEKKEIKKVKAEPKKVSAKKTEKKIVTPKVKKDVSEASKKQEHYFEATGRRKTAVARVRLYDSAEKTFSVNGKDLNVYFPSFEQREKCLSGPEKMDLAGRFKVVVVVHGGGLNAQAEAVRHGLSRALVLFDEELRKKLRKEGYLTRDPRKRERKKFGLKRARRAPQWKKR